eukprot:TRINITY_DN13923_c0_g1_i1.p1 TRINITY_DN13923_c0_g1~~TRINITY_DN13923_c0_g1_i1.p1  ORF type:complete len:534 (-),score=54.08 TRINITY_DN13923_c0_g1_i1:424-2025(-)
MPYSVLTSLGPIGPSFVSMWSIGDHLWGDLSGISTPPDLNLPIDSLHTLWSDPLAHRNNLSLLSADDLELELRGFRARTFAALSSVGLSISDSPTGGAFIAGVVTPALCGDICDEKDVPSVVATIRKASADAQVAVVCGAGYSGGGSLRVTLGAPLPVPPGLATESECEELGLVPTAEGPVRGAKDVADRLVRSVRRIDAAATTNTAHKSVVGALVMVCDASEAAALRVGGTVLAARRLSTPAGDANESGPNVPIVIVCPAYQFMEALEVVLDAVRAADADAPPHQHTVVAPDFPDLLAMSEPSHPNDSLSAERSIPVRVWVTGAEGATSDPAVFLDTARRCAALGVGLVVAPRFLGALPPPADPRVWSTVPSMAQCMLAVTAAASSGLHGTVQLSSAVCARTHHARYGGAGLGVAQSGGPGDILRALRTAGALPVQTALLCGGPVVRSLSWWCPPPPPPEAPPVVWRCDGCGEDQVQAQPDRSFRKGHVRCCTMACLRKAAQGAGPSHRDEPAATLRREPRGGNGGGEMVVH